MSKLIKLYILNMCRFMYFNYISMKVKKYFKKCKLLGLTPSSEMELDLKFNKLLRRFLETGRPTEKEHPKFNQM